jgi:glucose-6-phosphate 1-dehydrogenase
VNYLKQGTNDSVQCESEYNIFLDIIKYSKVEISNKDDYIRLKEDIQKIQKPDFQIIFYLSIAPEHFCDFIDNYKEI